MSWVTLIWAMVASTCLTLAGGTSTWAGNDLVTLTVVGVPKGGTTYYRLRRADDIKQ